MSGGSQKIADCVTMEQEVAEMTGRSAPYNQRAIRVLWSHIWSTLTLPIFRTVHIVHTFSYINIMVSFSSIKGHSEVTPLCPSLCLSFVLIPQETRKQQQQERCAIADRVGVQAGLLCEHLFILFYFT